MKKVKQPGENISLKTKKNEDPTVMEWLNAQSNLMDSIRYLIEREIQHYGVRNLQTVVPTERIGWREAGASVAFAPFVQAAGELSNVPIAGVPPVVAPIEQEPEEISEPELEEEELADEDIEAWV